MNRLTDIQKSEIIWNEYINIPGISPENLSMIVHPELEISNVNMISVGKWVNEQTYRHTRNSKLYKTNIQTSMEYFHKIWER